MVIENGVAAAAFEHHSPELFLNLFPDLKGKRIVLFLGRVHPKKRPDIAIEAFALAAHRLPDAILVIAGPGKPAYVESLKRLADARGVGARVHFTDLLQGDVPYSAFRSASLFLLPSLQENFGIAVAEALAAGCPVVESRHVDIHPEIEQQRAGVVCELRPQEFGAAIEEILEQPEEALDMGVQGQKIARRLFSWDRAAVRLDKIYLQLTKRAPLFL